MTQQEIDYRVSQAEILPLKISLVKMPLLTGARGVVCRDPDGGLMVIINSDLTAAEQAEAFTHEMLHIWNNDFDNTATVGQLEQLRHAAL